MTLTVTDQQITNREYVFQKFDEKKNGDRLVFFDW